MIKTLLLFFGVPLQFHKNRRICFTVSEKKCPVPLRGWKKCYYPEAVVSHMINVGFSDEPDFIENTHCQFQQYVGGCRIISENQTFKEYLDGVKNNTHCYHPNALTTVREFRCWSCNGVVETETERHDCP